jgi:uncharacterized protein (TIGR02001 family)
VLAVVLAFLLAEPAAAQLAASVSIDSDYRLRGYSLSDDHPVASAQATYDDRSGLYFSLSALNELGHGSRFLGVIGNAGYARRLNEHVTIDAGVLRTQIRSGLRYAPGYKYTEVYAGAYVGPFVGRVYYSPDYRTAGRSTLYGELEAGFEPAPKWRLSAHVGILTYLNSKGFYQSGDTHRDWRIGLSRQFGRLEIHSALSGGKPYEYFGFQVHKKVAATAGASFSF